MAIFLVLPVVFWWLTLFPAVITGDSVYLLEKIKGDTPDSLHTLAYYYTVKTLSFQGRFIFIVSFVQLILVAYTLRESLNAVFGNKLSPRQINVATGISLFTPFFGPISASLWKDVPYTCFTLLGLITLFRPFSDSEVNGPRQRMPLTKSEILRSLFFLFLGSLYRHEGPYILIFLSLILTLLVLIQQRRTCLWSGTFVLKSGILITSAMSALVFNLYLTAALKVEASPNYQRTISFLLDLQYVNSQFPNLLPRDIKQTLDLIQSGDSLNAAASCHSPFDIWGPGFNASKANEFAYQIPKLWVKSLNSNARSPMLNARNCRTASVSLPLFASIPKAGYWPTVGISPNEDLISRPKFAQYIYPLAFIWVYFWGIHGNFIAWPGLHMFLLIIPLLYLLRQKGLDTQRKGFYLSIALFLAVRSSTLWLTVGSQEFRYSFAVYFFSVPILIAFFINRTKFIPNKSK